MNTKSAIEMLNGKAFESHAVDGERTYCNLGLDSLALRYAVIVDDVRWVEIECCLCRKNAPAEAMRPEAGDGATECWVSDAHAYTVTEVSKNGLVLVIQQDTAIVIAGGEHNGSAEYRFERNPEGVTRRVRLTTRGGQVRWISEGGQSVMIGRRVEYRDPSY